MGTTGAAGHGGAGGAPIPAQLFIQGNLFDESGYDTVPSYGVTLTGTSPQSQVTDVEGRFLFTIPGGAQTLSFEVRDEDGILIGTFAAAVTDAGALDVAAGVQIAGVGFRPWSFRLRTSRS